MKKPHFIKQSFKGANVLFLVLSMAFLASCAQSETEETSLSAKTETVFSRNFRITKIQFYSKNNFNFWRYWQWC